jgi:hypothetical protein
MSALISTDNALYPTPERVSQAHQILSRERLTGEEIHPVARANCEQVLKFDRELRESA